MPKVDARVDSRVVRVSRVFRGCPPTPLLQRTSSYFSSYIYLPKGAALAASAWVQAAHFIDVETKGPWDQFPHLAISSAEKRCGKTTFLDLIGFASPRAEDGKFVNPSPASFYRVIEQCRPTIIMDESQSLKRQGSEASEVLRELMNASTRRDEYTARCVGETYTPKRFSIYSPKVFAQIGEVDPVLADRCVCVRLIRKTKDVECLRFRYRDAKSLGNQLRDEMAKWAIDNVKAVEEVYNTLEPFDSTNDRLADLLMPLQTVLTVAGIGLDELADYAEEQDAIGARPSDGVLLLGACREIFTKRKQEFVQTADLIADLCQRDEEPWSRYSHNYNITDEKLASLLREFGIRSERNQQQSARGYRKRSFAEAWKSYLTSAG